MFYQVQSGVVEYVTLFVLYLVFFCSVYMFHQHESSLVYCTLLRWSNVQLLILLRKKTFTFFVQSKYLDLDNIFLNVYVSRHGLLFMVWKVKKDKFDLKLCKLLSEVSWGDEILYRLMKYTVQLFLYIACNKIHKFIREHEIKL